MIQVTNEVVDYIGRYGGFCRDCADENGVCPSSGLPCAGRDKAIRHVLNAYTYPGGEGMSDQPPGLMSRIAFPIDHGRICVQEHWDISAPGCPMVRSPWHGQLGRGDDYIRQVVMTQAEFLEAGITLIPER